MNRRETDALYQVTVFPRGRDFDPNMFLLLLLDKTSYQLASDLSVLVTKTGPFCISCALPFFFTGHFQTDADSKYKELKENDNTNSSADLRANYTLHFSKKLFENIIFFFALRCNKKQSYSNVFCSAE